MMMILFDPIVMIFFLINFLKYLMKVNVWVEKKLSEVNQGSIENLFFLLLWLYRKNIESFFEISEKKIDQIITRKIKKCVWRLENDKREHICFLLVFFLNEYEKNDWNSLNIRFSFLFFSVSHIFLSIMISYEFRCVWEKILFSVLKFFIFRIERLNWQTLFQMKAIFIFNHFIEWIRKRMKQKLCEKWKFLSEFVCT